jgi:hypothetical protein
MNSRWDFVVTDEGLNVVFTNLQTKEVFDQGTIKTDIEDEAILKWIVANDYHQPGMWVYSEVSSKAYAFGKAGAVA